jgi:hypothetical protein
LRRRFRATLGFIQVRNRPSFLDVPNEFGHPTIEGSERLRFLFLRENTLREFVAPVIAK